MTIDEYLFPVFVRRGTAGARPLTAGARAPAGPGFAPPLRMRSIANVYFSHDLPIFPYTGAIDKLI